MADRTEKLAIIVEVVDQGSGKVTRLKGELSGLGVAGKASAAGLTQAHRGILGVGGATGAATRGISGMTGAFRHAKGAVGDLLSGPLGILGLGGGILALGGIIESSLAKTSEFGLSLEKLTALTGESAQSMGELSIVASKYGIEADKLAQIVGFTEKTLGKLDPVTGDNVASMKKLHKAQEGVTNASDKLHIAELKLKETEGKRHVTASQLATAEDRVRTAEQALADARNKLNAETAGAGAATSKLTDLEKQYGVRLTDTKGKALNFSQVLNNLADYYTSNASASDKAALASKIFGRGYAALIPILDLGSAGINRAKKAVDDMGLSLGTDSKGAMEAYKAALRQLEDAVNVLQIQIGLALAPTITDLANTISGFLEHGGAKQIVGFFKQGADLARAFGHVVQEDVLPVFGLIGNAWNAVPPEVRDLVIKGFVGDRILKVAFGFSPITFAVGSIEKGLQSGLGAVLGRFIGKGVVQPVFVTNPGIAGIPGAVGQAEGAGGGLAALAGGVVALLGVGAVEIAIAGVAGDWLKANVPGWGTPGGAATVGPVVIGGQSQSQAARAAADAAKAAAAGGGSAGLANPILDRGGREQGLNALAGKLKDDRVSLGQLLKANENKIASDGLAAMRGIWAPISGALRTLAHTTDPAKITAAVKELELTLVTQGHGNAANTRLAIKELQAQLKNTHDPTMQATLRHAIADLKAKIPGREYAERQIAKAERIIHSTQSTADKVHALQGIENDLKNHKLPGAATAIEHRINVLKGSVDLLPPRIAAVMTGFAGNPGKAHDDLVRPRRSGTSVQSTQNHREYAMGTDYVPRTGLALIHQGEAVLKPRDAVRYRAALMAPSLARAVMVQLQVSINVQPRVTIGLRELQERQARASRYGIVSAGT